MRIDIGYNTHNSIPMTNDSLRVGRALRERLREAGLSQIEVADAFGVSQSRVSRVLSGDFTGRSELAFAMCKRFEVAPVDAHVSEADLAFQAVEGALRSLWDGTAAGARRISKLIDAVRSIRPEHEAK